MQVQQRDCAISAARLADAGLRLDIAGAVATVTLARANRRNAQTPQMWAGLRDISAALPDDIRVAIVRGEGHSFSAGLDFAMFGPDGIPGAPGFADIARMPDAAADSILTDIQAAFTGWRRPGLVSVAAVQGHAVGAGFQLALACDLRVLADDAQFTMAETSRGLVPDLGGTGILVDLVGYPRALEICGTGRRVGADEALWLGLAEIVVPRDQLDGTVRDLVAALLAAPRDALVETKALLAAARGRTTEERLAAERAAQLRRLRNLTGRGD